MIQVNPQGASVISKSVVNGSNKENAIGFDFVNTPSILTNSQLKRKECHCSDEIFEMCHQIHKINEG